MRGICYQCCLIVHLRLDCSLVTVMSLKNTDPNILIDSATLLVVNWPAASDSNTIRFLSSAVKQEPLRVMKACKSANVTFWARSLLQFTSARARYESFVSSLCCWVWNKAISASSYFLANGTLPHCPPKSSTSFLMEASSPVTSSAWWICSFWKAEPVVLSMSRVCNSASFVFGHAAVTNSTFCW